MAKYATELNLHEEKQMFGLDRAIFRPQKVYREDIDIAAEHRNMIEIFVHEVMLGTDKIVFGGEFQTRTFSFADDVVPHIAAAPDTQAAINKVIYIGADTSCTL